MDQDGQVEALVAKRLRPDDNGKWLDTGEEVIIPTRAILVATGARPNVAYEFEHKGSFHKERGHYQTHHDVGGKLEPVPVAPHCKIGDFGPFTSYGVDGPPRQFSRRHAPGVSRQRGQGRGLRAAHLPQDRGGARRPREPERRHPGIPAIPDAHRGSAGGARGIGQAPHALGGGTQGARAHGGEALQGRAIFPPAEFRNRVGAGGRHAPADRGARHDRRARGPGHGHRFAHGDRARRQFAPGGGAQAGRTGGAHGPDRRARDHSARWRNHSLHRRPAWRGARAIHRRGLARKWQSRAVRRLFRHRAGCLLSG